MLIVGSRLALASDWGLLRKSLSRARLDTLGVIFFNQVGFTLLRGIDRSKLIFDLEKAMIRFGFE